MPEKPRRERIEAMLAEDPGDRFLRYSLAMEWQKEGEHERSLALLRALMREDPPYTAAYFMAAKQFVAIGQLEDSRAVLRDGIQAARNQGDNHAASEMSELLATLGKLGG